MSFFQNIFSHHGFLLRCASCPAANDGKEHLDLCPPCFALGPTLSEQHKPGHDYRVVDNGGFSVLGKEWTARCDFFLI